MNFWQTLFPAKANSLEDKILEVEDLLRAHSTSIDYKICETICTCTRSIWYKLHSRFLLNPSSETAIFERSMNVFQKTVTVLQSFDDADLDVQQREHLRDMIENVSYRMEKIAVILDLGLSFSQKIVRLDSVGEELEQHRTAKWAAREGSCAPTR